MVKNKVLVTGADGFIGSHLVEELLEQGFDIRAFCHYNSFNSWGWLENLSKNVLENIEIFTGDIRDPNGVRTALKGCYQVYHLAALIGIPYSYHSPDSYIDTNVKGTLNVIQASRDLDLDRIIVTSTSEVYGTAKYVPINEDHPRQAQSPYSASKIAADSIAESFYRSFNLPITIVRPFNTYGPRQSSRAIIPSVITQLAAGREQIQLGDLTPTRDMVFVKDTVRGFVNIANCDTLIGQDCNIATNTEISMSELVNTIIMIMNPIAKIVLDSQRLRPEKSEVRRLFGDNSKLLNHTDWRPRNTLEVGISKTIDWFTKKENLKHYKTGIYNV